MQPSDKRAKLKKATVARCRMFRKAYLAFLPGFPVPDESLSVRWCTPTAGLTGECRTLTPEDIRQAVYGWSEMHKFPRVFPQTVDDAAAWHREIPMLLERLGKAVHGKERLPECLLEISTGFAKNDVRRAKILAASSPELRQLLNAASWLMLLAPEQLTPLVDWLEAEPEAATGIMRNWPGVEGVNLVLALHRFREEDGHARWQRIIETFAAPQAKKIVTYFSWYHTKWKEILLDISRRTRHPKPSQRAASYEQESPECPEPEWLTLVYTLCEKAVAMPKNERRQVLNLFTDCVPPGLLHRWGVWWQGATPVVAQAERLLSRM